ncbi:MAG: serine protease [Deinococcus sp.]|nr:serine protease [Deinococcus sp.]
MKRNLSLLALTGTLALGGFVGYGLNERSTAQTAPTPLATQSPDTTTSTTTYDNGRARTEAEANTVQVVKQRQNGLVYISVTESADNSPEAQMRQRLQQQFGFPGGDGSDQPQTGTGSGFFVNAAGDIITNNHVVEGASEITIRLHGSKKTYKAKVVGRAPDFDLALIRAEGLPAGAIQPIPLGDSTRLDVGLKAIAMGAPFGLDFSVSEGIISSLERTVPVGTKGVQQQVIQTDAAINPGNSGGPLLSSSGELIGVNTQIYSVSAANGTGQSAGVGFAIPVNTVAKLLPQLQAAGGKVVQTPTLGIQFTDLSALTDEDRQQANLPAAGALLQRVYPNSPAAAAGLNAGTGNSLSLNTPGQAAEAVSTDGDIITAIDGQSITEGDDLRRAVIGKRIGDSIKLTVQRDGKKRDVTVKLQAFTLPADQ